MGESKVVVIGKSGIIHTFLKYEHKKGKHYFEEELDKLMKNINAENKEKVLLAILAYTIKIYDVAGNDDYTAILYSKKIEIPEDAKKLLDKYRIEVKYI